MKHWQLALLFAIFFPCATLPAQSAPAVPAQRSFHDPAYRIAFNYPANWNFARRDREISTFRLDARSAARTTTNTTRSEERAKGKTMAIFFTNFFSNFFTSGGLVRVVPSAAWGRQTGIG